MSEEEMLRESALDYHKALKAYHHARANLHNTEEEIKANLSANKLYDTYHVHVEGARYVCFEYNIEFPSGFIIKEETMNLVDVRHYSEERKA
tara:strand:+ start:1384 stop:1659 length:276 start_codon:yes stop_codon:yes gene_type:complete